MDYPKINDPLYDNIESSEYSPRSMSSPNERAHCRNVNLNVPTGISCFQSQSIPKRRLRCDCDTDLDSDSDFIPNIGNSMPTQISTSVNIAQCEQQLRSHEAILRRLVEAVSSMNDVIINLNVDFNIKFNRLVEKLGKLEELANNMVGSMERLNNQLVLDSHMEELSPQNHPKYSNSDQFKMQQLRLEYPNCVESFPITPMEDNLPNFQCPAKKRKMFDPTVSSEEFANQIMEQTVCDCGCKKPNDQLATNSGSLIKLEDFILKYS